MEKKNKKLLSPIAAWAPAQLMRREALLVQVLCCVLELGLLPPYVSSRALYKNMWTHKLG